MSFLNFPINYFMGSDFSTTPQAEDSIKNRCIGNSYDKTGKHDFQPELPDSSTLSTEKSALPTQSNIGDKKLLITKLFDDAVEICEGIFDGIAPHIFKISPWKISRMVNMRFIPVIFLRVSSTSLSFSTTSLSPVGNVENLQKIDLIKRKPFSERVDGWKNGISLKALPTKCFSTLKGIYKLPLDKTIEKVISIAVPTIVALELLDVSGTVPQHIDQVSRIAFESLHLINTLIKLKNIQTLPWKLKAVGGISALTSTLSYLDLIGMFPQQIGYRMGLDALLVGSSLLGSGYALAAGYSHLAKGFKSQELNLKTRISHFVSGTILGSLGMAEAYSTCLTTHKLVQGLSIFHGTDPLQQEGILKHRSIQTLGEQKKCNAVIIDGASSKWGELGDDISFPSGELMYEHCNTHYMRANSSTNFCENLSEASKILGGPINAVTIQGHASSNFQKLNKDYILRPHNSEEFSCMNEHLDKNAQIFFLGCNTATSEDNLPQVASNLVPERETTGFASFLDPTFTTNTYEDGRFKIDSLMFLRNGQPGIAFTSPFNAKTYLNGAQVNSQ